MIWRTSFISVTFFARTDLRKSWYLRMTAASWKDHGELEDCNDTMFSWWVCEVLVWPTEERNQPGCYQEDANKSFQDWSGVMYHMKGSSTGSVGPLWEAKTVPKGWVVIASIAPSWLKGVWFQIQDSEVTIINSYGIFTNFTVLSLFIIPPFAMESTFIS